MQFTANFATERQRRIESPQLHQAFLRHVAKGEAPAGMLSSGYSSVASRCHPAYSCSMAVPGAGYLAAPPHIRRSCRSSRGIFAPTSFPAKNQLFGQPIAVRRAEVPIGAQLSSLHAGGQHCRLTDFLRLIVDPHHEGDSRVVAVDERMVEPDFSLLKFFIVAEEIAYLAYETRRTSPVSVSVM